MPHTRVIFLLSSARTRDLRHFGLSLVSPRDRGSLCKERDPSSENRRGQKRKKSAKNKRRLLSSRVDTVKGVRFRCEKTPTVLFFLCRSDPANHPPMETDGRRCVFFFFKKKTFERNPKFGHGRKRKTVTAITTDSPRGRQRNDTNVLPQEREKHAVSSGLSRFFATWGGEQKKGPTFLTQRLCRAIVRGAHWGRRKRHTRATDREEKKRKRKTPALGPRHPSSPHFSKGSTARARADKGERKKKDWTMGALPMTALPTYDAAQRPQDVPQEGGGANLCAAAAECVGRLRGRSLKHFGCTTEALRSIEAFAATADPTAPVDYVCMAATAGDGDMWRVVADESAYERILGAGILAPMEDAFAPPLPRVASSLPLPTDGKEKKQRHRRRRRRPSTSSSRKMTHSLS